MPVMAVANTSLSSTASGPPGTATVPKGGSVGSTHVMKESWPSNGASSDNGRGWICSGRITGDTL
ncbi:hypothetical protein Nans01_03300 [Nocardiopsis ansamitocini]|uniref:Uncharacterized protein n=1 Tax=Nocardiopsis ansamitocini TaxID=1670832 RepID=A0A9W6UGY2_9ACTN|nr:hypothetical protein Nans01_03300 [Nocardiopsis ansamitocini]